MAPPARNGRALLDELKWRQLEHQCTDRDGLAAHLDSARGVYCGFDPTADSLTIGNLVPMMLLAHFRRAGHRVVVVQGGATGRIGDPSGKEAERAIREDKDVEDNLRKQEPIFNRVLKAPSTGMDAAGLPPIEIVDNYEWFKGIGFIQALREIGKHFSVNEMIKRDSVRNRLEGRDQGISYTEFSYVLLQAYDYLHLFREKGVSVQAAGADQWGNIVSGCDLVRRYVSRLEYDVMTPVLRLFDYSREPYNARIREMLEPSYGRNLIEYVGTPAYDELIARLRNSSDIIDVHARLLIDEALAIHDERDHLIQTLDGGSAFGFTAPLLTKSDGTKFGKTESGAVWLSAKREPGFERGSGTSAYAFFQFWLNADDGDVVKYLKIFTFLTLERIEELARLTESEPHRREAQRVLAREVTAMVHGGEAMQRAEEAGKALFSGEVAGLDLETIDEVFVGVPSAAVGRDQLQGDGLPLTDALVLAGLAKSKREAREFLGSGAVLLNGEKAGADDALMLGGLLHGRVALLRRGKKQWAVVRVEDGIRDPGSGSR